MPDAHLFSHEDSKRSSFIYNNMEEEYEISFSIIRIFFF